MPLFFPEMGPGIFHREEWNTGGRGLYNGNLLLRCPVLIHIWPMLPACAYLFPKDSLIFVLLYSLKKKRASWWHVLIFFLFFCPAPPKGSKCPAAPWTNTVIKYGCQVGSPEGLGQPLPRCYLCSGVHKPGWHLTPHSDGGKWHWVSILLPSLPLSTLELWCVLHSLFWQFLSCGPLSTLGLWCVLHSLS